MPRERVIPWPDRVDRVLDYLHRNPTADHTLHSVAAAAGVSPYHFHRIFRTITGETLATSVRRIRLERAVGLMRTHPHRPLGMIALEAGFGSHSEFTRAFRRWFGLVPSAWDRRSRLAPASVQETSSWNGPGIQELIRTDTGPPVRASRIRLPRVRVAYARVIRPFESGALARGWDRLQAWMARRGVSLPGSGLVGMSWDDVEATPLDQIRYDLAIEVDPATPPAAGIGMHDLPAMECLSARAVGNLARVARVWDHLYRVSLPGARRDPGNWPAQERYRAIPDFSRDDGWDLDCVVPLR